MHTHTHINFPYIYSFLQLKGDISIGTIIRIGHCMSSNCACKNLSKKLTKSDH